MNEFNTGPVKPWTSPGPEVMNILGLSSHIMIGGSWVVDPNAANDIDLVLPQWEFTAEMQNVLLRRGFHQLQNGDEKYDEIDHMRLIAVLERPADESNKKINVIIVGHYFWPAYCGAIRRMHANPEKYSTRDERVELHRGLCKQIADMIQHDLGY